MGGATGYVGGRIGAALGAALVIVAISLPWYSAETTVGIAGFQTSQSESVTGWEAFSTTDVALAALAALAGALAIVSGLTNARRALLGVGLCGAAILLIVLYRVVEAPPVAEAGSLQLPGGVGQVSGTVGPDVGPFIAVAAAIVILAGAVWAYLSRIHPTFKRQRG